MRHGSGIAALSTALGLGLAVPPASAAPTAVAPPAAASARFASLVAGAQEAMNADPEKALAQARAAARLAPTLSDPRARDAASARAGWIEGEALLRVNRPEEAQPVIAAALAAVVRAERGGKLHGDLLRSSAGVEVISGQIQKALSDLQAAHGIFARLGEARSRAMTLQDIGTIYLDARDYDRALKYDAQAAEAYAGDPEFTVALYNNSGETLKEMGRFDEAIDFYRRALKLARGDAISEVRVMTNLASAQLKAGDAAQARATADRALAAAGGTEWEPFLWGVKAQVALAQRRPDEAQGFIERAFAGTDLAATTPQYRDLHEAASRIYQARGDAQAAFAHLAAFKRLDDELREIAVSTNAGLMTARFDFANQELSIARLKAGQLQRDVALERSRARLSKITLYGLVAALALAALVLAGALWSLFSIRRSRNEVALANDSLSGVNAELETALAAKTRFLATTSHEIRTPLNGILGMTQVMLHDRDMDPVQRDRVRIVHDAGETMKALVDDILDVAKIETGTVTIDRSEVRLRDMLGGVSRLWAGQASAKGLALDVDIDGCPPLVLGDERRLRQIVFNLLSNAIKFTEEGRVSLRATTADGVFVLAVRDTGIGIPADQLEAVFASFHQVDGATTRRYGGTGLGLSICNDLVRAMGGAIALESELGAGSTFTVRIPVEVPAAAAAATSDAAWPASLADARLLIVEDNPLARSIMSAALGAHFAEVVATAAADAPAAVAAGRFHHAVIDCGALARIDDASGFVAGIAQGSQGGVATLLFAVDLDPELDAAYLRAGAAQLLRRPIAPAALADALARAHRDRDAAVTAVAAEKAPAPAAAARSAA